ncbi:MAG TPA: branched-chain amino acid ABC transporter permease [Xanthobacteraceae bacterium]|nr:branched-chain amino acid ABC transporter permease [Xanthobacteraceae bacterium]
MTTVGQLVFSGLLIGGIYALMSIGLTLIFGVLRIVNFAHGEFLMVAMYGAWAMTRYLGLNPYYSIVAIVPAMFLFGIVVHRLIVMPALDKPHLVVVFATMGLSILMQNVALMALSADLQDVPPILGGRSFTFGPFYAKPELLIGFAVAVACTLGLRFMLQATNLGKAIRATVQDGEAAQLKGVPVPRIFLITFAAGSALVGLSACIMTPLFSVFPTVGLNFVLSAFVIVVLGGMGSQVGVAVAAVVMIGGTEIMRELDFLKYIFGNDFDPTQYRMLLFGFAMVLIMIWKPRGLVGTREPSAFYKERRTILGSMVKEGHG